MAWWSRHSITPAALSVLGFECKIRKFPWFYPLCTLSTASQHGISRGKSRGAKDALLLRAPVWEFSPSQQTWLTAAAIWPHFLFILAKVSTKSSGTASKCNIFIAFWSVQSLLNFRYNVLSFCFAFLLWTAWFRNWCFWHIFKLSFKINTFPRGEGNLRPLLHEVSLAKQHQRQRWLIYTLGA